MIPCLFLLFLFLWALDVHLFVLSIMFICFLSLSFLYFISWSIFLHLFIYVYSFYVLLIFHSLFRAVLCNLSLSHFFLFLFFTSMFFLAFWFVFRAILFPSVLGMLILPYFFFFLFGNVFTKNFSFFSLFLRLSWRNKRFKSNKAELQTMNYNIIPNNSNCL